MLGRAGRDVVVVAHPDAPLVGAGLDVDEVGVVPGDEAGVDPLPPLRAADVGVGQAGVVAPVFNLRAGKPAPAPAPAAATELSALDKVSLAYMERMAKESF